MSHKKADIQISPFTFPSETDARFLLLIGIAVLSTLGLIYALVGGVVLKQGHLPAFLVAVGLTVIVFVWALRLARRDAHMRIQAKAWKAFPPSYPEDSLQKASLQRMNCYIHQIVECIPSVKALSPKFVWDDISKKRERPTGMAFGFGGQKFVCLRQGLHEAFIKEREKFHAVFLHELGHLENRDVNKTIFSIALGRICFPTVLIVIFALDIYWVWAAALEKMMGDRSLDTIWEGGSVIASINLQAILLMLLIEIIRSSILRVREYYADARARAWIGNPNAFFDLFGTSKKLSKGRSSSQEGDDKQFFLMTLWRILAQSFREHLAPLHPTNRQRVNALLNPRLLLRPSYEVSFLVGLLSGLSINSSLLIAIVSTDFWESLKDFVNPTSQKLIVRLMGVVILTSTSLVFFICTLAPMVIFGCISIASTVGCQIQAATLVDKTAISRERYKRVIQLAILSLLLGLGFTLGCLLYPVKGPLSLVPTPNKFFLVLPTLPFYIGLWGGVFLLWMLPLSWIASCLYVKHIGDQIPRNKQRFLTVISAVALLPIFVSTSFVQAILSIRHLYLSSNSPDSVRELYTGFLSNGNLVFWLILISFFALTLKGIVWGVGWLMMIRRGWLKRTHCSNCDASIPKQFVGNQTCHLCQYPLQGWLEISPPLSLPPLPPPPRPVPPEDAPPLRF
jgi:Zn-dependent protease with chaperone function